MKRILFSFCLALPVAFAGAAGPYSISVGSGAGSLAFTNIFSDGQVIGDDGMFDPEGAVISDYTVYRNYFMVHNVTDNVTFWADNVAAHVPEIPDGTVATNPAGFTNVGIDFGNNLAGSLAVTMAQPAPGDSAGIQFTWNIANLSATPKAVRIIWFMDVDSYLASNAYDDDMCVRLANTFGGGGSAIAVGEGTPNTSVNGALGVLLESSVPATRVFGVADPPTGSYGSTYYWTNENNFVGLGPEVNKEILPSIGNTVQNDADNNGAADVAGDVAGATQVDLMIAPSAAPSVTFQAVWGTNVTYSPLSSVSGWMLY